VFVVRPPEACSQGLLPVVISFPLSSRRSLAAALTLALVVAGARARLLAQGAFVRGDCDQSGRLDITDPITILGFLFLGSASPVCLDACDVDDSERIDISDAIYELSFLFLGGPPPRPPWPGEDIDPSGDLLTCLNGKYPPGELRLTPARLIFHRLGQSQAIAVSGVEEDGTAVDLRAHPAVRFTSRDPKVATIGAGLVTARGVGTTRIEAYFRGRTAAVEVEVLPGADGAPVLKITSPSPGAVVASAVVPLSGSSSDPLAELSLRIGAGEETPLENERGRFSAAVPLELGENLVTVLARGASGAASVSLRLRRVEPGAPGAAGPDGRPFPAVPLPRIDPPDDEPPRLEIVSPRKDALLESALVEVAGIVDDPEAEVRVNGFLAENAGGFFRLKALRLPAGRSRITAVATDRAGNSTAAMIEVTVDISRPRIAITSAGGDSAAQGELLVAGSGSVTVSGTVAPAGTAVTVNGVPARVTGTAFSADLTLPGGFHALVATASSGGKRPRRAQAVRGLYVDLLPPDIEILHPGAERLLGPGFRTELAAVTIHGRAWDPGVPLERGEQILIRVNSGPPAAVLGQFAVSAPLAPGENRIQLSAEDARGRRSTLELKVLREAIPPPTPSVFSGDVQSVPAGEALPQPLVARVLDAAGFPLQNAQVTFRVIAGSGSLGGGLRLRAVATGADGRVSVSLVTGAEVGSHSQLVAATLPGRTDSPLLFSAHTTLPAGRVLAAHSRRQLTAAAGELAPEPLAARLLDRSGNPVPSGSVRFRVLSGGALLQGAAEVTRSTNAAGVARAAVQLPLGDVTSVIEATSAGAEPVRFHVRGLAPGAVLDTELAGVVADDRGEGVPGVRVRLAGLPELEALSDALGAFRIRGAPAGAVLLLAGPKPGFGASRLRAAVVAGRRNELGEALRLARLEPGSHYRELPVGPERGGVLTLPALSGFRLEVAAGAALFPGGSRSGVLQAALPNLRILSEPAPSDIQVEVPVLILPEGVRFDPPARLVISNPGLAPGRLPRRYEHEAAAGGFIELAPGVVSEDAGTVATRHALGAHGGGLHFFAVPGPPGGRTGAIEGEVLLPAPWLFEVPQRPASHVAGSNVYVHSGEFFLDEVDLEVRGRGLHYRFRRRYESRHRFRGSLGWNWEHEYADRRLIPALLPGNLLRADGAGRFDEYLWDEEGGRHVSPPGVFARLFRDGEGFWIERLPDGTRHRYHPLDGSGAAGRLESIADRSGNRLRILRREDGLIEEVREPLGRSIAYFHDAEGRITRISDFAGRSVRFEYDARGDLVAVIGPAVTGTLTGNDFPAGRRTEYAYSSGFADERLNHNLLRVIDPREVASGSRRPRLINHYGERPGAFDFDRVVAQDWGGAGASGVEAGGRVTFEYTDLSPFPSSSAPDAAELAAFYAAEAGWTRITDRAGLSSEVRWSGAGLPLAVRQYTAESRPRDPRSLHPPPGIAPPYYETRRRWSAEGLLAAIEHPRGNRVEYLYDTASPLRTSRGNCIREASYPPAGEGAAEPEVVLRAFDPLFAREVLHVPARDPGDASLASRRLLDYQEASDLESLAAEAGLDPADLEEALEMAGVRLGLGDLNGDGVTGGRRGDIVREIEPPATLPGGKPQPLERLFTYNAFGQPESRRDGNGALTRWEYHPESDPDGDGKPSAGSGLDPVTGGFLKRQVVDAEGLGGAAPLALTTSWLYDPLGYPARQVDPRGNEVFFAHNQLGELIEWRLPPPLKYRRWFIYDAGGNLVRVRTENYTATDSNFHLLVSENLWIDEDREYDILDQLTAVTREVSGGEVGPARSITLRYERDPNGRIIRALRPGAASATVWEYDERGLLIAETRGAGGPDAARRVWHRDENGNVVLALDAEDSDGDGEPEAESFVYDGWDRLIARTDAAGGLRLFERERGGLIVSEAFLGKSGGPTPRERSGAANELLERTDFRRDERGRLVEVARHLFGGSGPPRVLLEQIEHDAEGRIVRRLAPGGGERRFVHDAAGRPLEEHDGNGDRVLRLFDAAGNVVRERRESFSLAVVDTARAGDPDYDERGRLRRSSEVVHVYDPLHRPILTVDQEGGTWRARYDVMGNLILASDASGTITGAAAEPELAGVLSLLSQRQRDRINAHGNRVRLRYDNLGRLVSAVHELRRDGHGGADIDGQNPFNLDGLITERLEWDDDNRLVAWIDDLGHRTALAYDGAGHIARKTWPDGSVEVIECDRDGNPRRITDQNGTVVLQRFDALHRLVERSISPAEKAGVLGTTLQRFEYDGLSRLTFAFDDNDPADAADDSAVMRRYDSLGRLVEEWQDRFAFSWEYDDAGRVTARRSPGGRRLETPRDRSGAIAFLRDEDGVLSAYERFGDGSVIEKRLRGGVVLSYLEPDDRGVLRLSGYDARGQIARHVYTTATGELLQGFEYGREANGFPLYERHLHRERGLGDVWRYDSVHRVSLYLPNVFDPRVPPVDPIRQLRFSTDGNHNWRFVDVDQSVRRLRVNERSAYTDVNGEPLLYDARGNLRRSGAREYLYDALDRLVRVVHAGQTISRYRYDAVGAEAALAYGGSGRRIAKEVPRPAPGQPAGAVRYTHDGLHIAEERRPDGELLRQYLREDGGRPAALLSYSAGDLPRPYLYIHTANGSTAALLDTGGRAAEGSLYGLHGELVLVSSFGGRIDYTALGNHLQFGGLAWDHELGFHSAGARYFNPQLGRFLTEAGPFVPQRPLQLNRYLHSGLEPLPGEVSGGGSRWRRQPALAPYRVRFPVDARGRFEPPAARRGAFDILPEGRAAGPRGPHPAAGGEKP
jgi:RHS repeat-associated protein